MSALRFISLFEATSEYTGWADALAANPLLATGARLCGEIEALGGEALIVGGVVRDLLLGKPVADVDIATNVPIERIEEHFDTVEVGRSREFGILTVKYGGEEFEVANYRSEEGYADNRRPDTVSREQTFAADAKRRDLTINAMGIDRHGNITDYHGGVAHLADRVVQTVGDPHTRFDEDALRLLRAARFAARLGFSIAPETEAAMSDLAFKVNGVAPERVREELFKAAKAGGPVLADYVEHLDRTGMLAHILPEVSALKGLEHRPEHHPEGGVWEHVLAAVRASGSLDPVHNLAVLFHDLGKAVTRGYHDDGRVHYHGHEEAGVPVFRRLAARLRFPNAARDAIAHAVEHHMKGHNLDGMADKKVLALRQSPHWDTFHTVVRADAAARGHLWDPVKFDAMMARVEDLFHRFGDSAEFERRMSTFIDGRKIAALTGASGAEIGRIKTAVRDEIVRREFNVTVDEVEAMIVARA